MKNYVLILLCYFLVLPYYLSANEGKQVLDFKSLPLHINIPTDVQQIYQDREGFLWFATRNGLCRYDGYELKTLKSNFYTPDALTSNDVLTVHEDYNHRLWIGTTNGLNILNKRTGEIFNKLGALNYERIQTILMTKDSTVWIGTHDWLYKFKKSDKEDISYNDFARIRKLDVKSLVEAPDNQIWIGTWSNGLYRYVTATDSLISYPAFNPMNSAYCVFKDSKENIWVGTWGYGLYKVHNPYETGRVSFERFNNDKSNDKSLIHDLIHSISEDTNTGILWIGTAEGLSCYDGKEFHNYAQNGIPNRLPSNEIITTFYDRNGIMWLGFLGGRVYWAKLHELQFKHYQPILSNNLGTSNNIQSIEIYKDELWLGMEKHNFSIYNLATHSYLPKDIFKPFFATAGSIYSFLKRKNKDELWLGSWNGVYIYNPNNKMQPVKHLYSANTPGFLDNIFCLFEDNKQNIYIGTADGLCIYDKDGKVRTYKNLNLSVGNNYSHTIYTIAQDSLENIWIGTAHNGIFRLSASPVNGQCQFIPYTTNNDKINSNEIQCIFVDHKGHILAGTDGGGLSLYDSQKDSFIPIHTRYNLPGDMICSILEDNQQNLWMGSNVGLIRLNLNDSLSDSKHRIFTTYDGLQDNKFSRGAACKSATGEMFFGGPQGYNAFYPEDLTTDIFKPQIVITDIQIKGKNVNRQPAKGNVTDFTTTEFLKELRLSYKQNEFTCKVSVLNYYNPEKNEYAYRLEGLDKSWQYLSNGNNTISYPNLNSGKYTLYIKGSNGNGNWSEDQKILTITVTPPWWLSKTAYILYAIAIIILTISIISAIKKKIRKKHLEHIKELEHKKNEELSRAKLQFFTNITHELLTPLTVISVALDEIKSSGTPEYYAIMENNINRLKRLLQQILEFRKAESGNLKLKVSQGNITSFIMDSINSFLPIVRNKKIQLSTDIKKENIIGYFDPDKLDKILYNLLSNAFKYNREGNTVKVSVTPSESEKEIMITVSDDGDGIPQDILKNLFKRFQEGNFRKYGTTGHGIGLSLTQELVTLHHGKISVESQQGAGTTFYITLPIEESSFNEEEIDRNVLVSHSDNGNTNCDIEGAVSDIMGTSDENVKKEGTILLVEDNEELLTLISDALSHTYQICKARNGQEAIEQLKNNSNIKIIISDIMMPIMNGTELCQYVKTQEEYLHIPVILLSAKNSEADMIEGYEAGADDYITKPFRLPLLMAKIKSLLKNKESLLQDYTSSIFFKMQKTEIDSTDKEFLQNAINCVYDNLDNAQFDQQMFAEIMKVSKSTLYRRIKKLTGDNPSNFISDIRLQTAYKIISDNPNIRISELAYTTGYNDPKYFSYCFKKRFGILPSEVPSDTPSSSNTLP